MEKHFVSFYTPGAFVANDREEPIDSWDVEVAIAQARFFKARYGGVPYGFRFTTRSRGPEDLDSKESARSPFYWLGGTVFTLAEVEARRDPDEVILLGNMRSNGWGRIVVNRNSWTWTAPLGDTDVVLDVDLTDRGRR